jgi:tyrosine-protein phosphatase SIW14
MTFKLLPARVLAALLLAAAPASLYATSTAAPRAALDVARATVRIDNFGEVNANYYRGAQPEKRDYRDLAALGVKMVIDLTRDGRSDEPGLVKAAGMKFVRIPLTTTERPSEQAVAQFLQLVNDPANQPVYVHCQGGRHRTGTMTAVYRMTQDGWTADQAYAEMKQFRFEGFPGHPELKSFVYDYYSQVAHRR